MSTITIRVESDPPSAGPRREAQLFIDGVRIFTGPHPFTMQVDAAPIELSPSTEDSDGGKWRTYAPGVRRHTLIWGDVLVMDTTDEPERTDIGNGMVEWTWRNVALEVRG